MILTKPVQNPGNPIWDETTSAEPWLYHNTYVIQVGDMVHCWYNARLKSDGTFIGIGYKYSTDRGDTWVVPVLNLVSYGGNTNNNLVLPGFTLSTPHYNDSASPDYDATLINGSGEVYKFIFPVIAYDGITVKLYGSVTGTVLDLMADITSAFPYGYVPDSINRINGLWIAYYQYYGYLAHRSIAATSRANLLSGTWTKYGGGDGIILPYASENDQKYRLSSFRLDGVIYCYVPTIDYTAPMVGQDNHMKRIELYSTVDGFTLTPLDMTWIEYSTVLWDWNNGIMVGSGLVTRNDGTFRFYYFGSPWQHQGTEHLLEAGVGYVTFQDAATPPPPPPPVWTPITPRILTVQGLRGMKVYEHTALGRVQRPQFVAV